MLSLSCGVSFGTELWLMMHPFFGKNCPWYTQFLEKDCTLHPFWLYIRKIKEKFHTWCTPFDCTLARKADPKWSPPPQQEEEEEEHLPCLELSAIAAAKNIYISSSRSISLVQMDRCPKCGNVQGVPLLRQRHRVHGGGREEEIENLRRGWRKMPGG